MMYRVCARLLGRDFIWTILEQARFDLLARDEKYLLNSRMSYVTNDEYDSRCSAELADDDGSGCGNYNLSTMPSSFYQRLKQTSSWLFSQKRSASVASQSSPNAEFTLSEKSASLHLLWDDPQWDEETDFCLYGDVVHRGHCSLLSDVSDMTEFRAAKGLFEESDDCCKMNKQDQGTHESIIDCSNREETSSDLDTNDFIQKNCMVDSKHLYQITTGFITRTNSISVSSEHSSQSFLSLRQRLNANASSGGLLELVQSSPTTSPMISADQMIASMTDSGISRGTISTSILNSSTKSSTGAKCSFGAERFSSEEEVLDVMAIPFTLTTNRNSIIGEDRCSVATSVRSMEWFEDNYCPFVAGEEDLKEPLKARMDDPLASCFSHINFYEIRPSSSESRQKHMYNVTRDLMAWAKDQFTPKSPQLKALQSLYISHQRWRRIGLKRSSNCSEQFLSSLLHLMFIRGIPFFSCSDVLITAKVSPFDLQFSLH
uniref:Bm4553 n=1 Tax=Elaeophora elaphi TaxID=1147741 RepID=A0A0R3S6P5_9BILA